MMATMIRTLERAIAEAANLPELDEEQTGRRLLAHIAKPRRLRAEIDKRICSLDAGEGRPVDIEQLLRQQKRNAGG